MVLSTVATIDFVLKNFKFRPGYHNILLFTFFVLFWIANEGHWRFFLLRFFLNNRSAINVFLDYYWIFPNKNLLNFKLILVLAVFSQFHQLFWSIFSYLLLLIACSATMVIYGNPTFLCNLRFVLRSYTLSLDNHFENNFLELISISFRSEKWMLPPYTLVIMWHQIDLLI